MTYEEHRHEPGDEHWWNESWYFDWATPTSGGYVRVGLVPNQGSCWYLLVLVTPDGVVRVDDKTAPLPTAEGLTVHGISHTRHGDTWRISGTTTAESLTAEEVLQGRTGRPSEVTIDLTWTSDGPVFEYDVTTRYEVPCLVSGTVNGRRVDSAEGQRDHSWGVRDWRASCWCWASARLADGTRIHVTDVVLPQFRFTTGYDGPVTVTDVERTQTVDGLPRTARLRIAPTGTDVTVTPIAHGPTLITDEGVTWPFHRTMATFTTDAGDGLGWIEWNEPPVS